MTKKRILSFVLAAFLVLGATAAAAAQSLVAGGRAIGIKLRAEGVIVAETTAVETGTGVFSPAEAAGVKPGDIITKLGSAPISSAEDFKAALKGLTAEETSLVLLRGGKEKSLKIKPARDADGRLRLGILLRDGVSGIGTLSFYDPETGFYGALGHSISDDSSGQLIPLGEGSVYSAEVVGLKKGEAGAPGALEGQSEDASPIGDIRKNCSFGIFGTAVLEGKRIETGIMRTGKAKVLCTVSGDEVREYGIELRRVYEDGESRTALVSVTDPKLLSLTGGIVQGMSGSPIIQEGRLVGAVTHVFVNDPTQGYAISIQDMLREAETMQRAA